MLKLHGKSIMRFVFSKSVKNVFSLLVLDIFAAFIPLLTAWSLKTLLDNLSTHPLFEISILAIAMFVLFGFMQSVFATIREYVVKGMETKTKRILNRILIVHTRVMPVIDFDAEEKFRDLMKAKNSADFFVNMVNSFSSSVRTLLVVITFTYALWSIDPLTAILSLLIGIPALYFAGKVAAIEFQVHQDQHQRQRVVDYIADLLIKPNSARETKLYGSGGYLIGRWERMSRSLIHENLKVALKTMMMESSVMIVGLILFFFAWIRLVGLVLDATNDFAGVTLIALIPFAISVYQNIQNGQRDFKLFVKAWKGWSIYKKIFERPQNEKKDLFERISGESTSERISSRSTSNTLLELHAIGFKYPDAEEWTLKDIHLSIGDGETIALVGENGSGKSTLAKIIAGVYAPTTGTIRLYGSDFTHHGNLLKKITSFLYQNPIRYPLSLVENISMKRLPNHRLQRLVDMFHLQDIKQSVHRLGVGFAGGTNLSGGQWQKVSMARAFAKRNPKLFIVDEPTASLDPEAEVEAFRFFRKHTQNVATVIISHRLGFAKEADKIVYLKEGMIKEMGTHEQLMKLNGEYASLYRMQSAWYKEGSEWDRFSESLG